MSVTGLLAYLDAGTGSFLAAVVGFVVIVAALVVAVRVWIRPPKSGG